MSISLALIFSAGEIKKIRIFNFMGFLNNKFWNLKSWTTCLFPKKTTC